MVNLELSDDEALNLMIDRYIPQWLRDRLSTTTGISLTECPSVWLRTNVNEGRGWDDMRGKYGTIVPFDWDVNMKNNNKIGCITAVRTLAAESPEDFDRYFPNYACQGHLGLGMGKQFVERWYDEIKDHDARWLARRKSLNDHPEVAALYDLD